MQITDIIMSFPGIALLISYAMGRGVVISEKEKDHIIAARVLGKNDFKYYSMRSFRTAFTLLW
jgi:ABC-type dipeptide/oligopeptide/nickel transport system permease subunit